jgi:hypothetical protein
MRVGWIMTQANNSQHHSKLKVNILYAHSRMRTSRKRAEVFVNPQWSTIEAVDP